MNIKKANAMETIDIAENFINNIEDSILIVDDSKFSRKILNDILHEEGFTVIAEARNGQEAVELAKERKPKYVFLDVEMPILDGLGALPLILEAYPGTNVIMCTAMGQQNIIEEAVREGAKDYVLKPYKKESIISIMNSMIAINRQVIPFDRGRRNQDKAIEPVKVDFDIEEISAIDNLDACKEELQEFSQTSDDEVKQLINSIESQELDELLEDYSNVIDFAVQAQEVMDEDEPMEGLEAPVELLINFMITDEEADPALIESVKEDFDKIEIINEGTEEKELENEDLVCNEIDNNEIESGEILSEGLESEGLESEGLESEGLESEEIVSEEIVSEEIESEELESEEIVSDEIVSEEIENEELESGEIVSEGLVNDELLREEIIKEELVSEAPVKEEAVREEAVKEEIVKEEVTYEVKTKEELTNEEQAIAELVQEVLVETKEEEEEPFEEKIYSVEPVIVISDETIEEETIADETIEEETIADEIIEDETIEDGTIKEEAAEEGEGSEDFIKNEAKKEEDDHDEKAEILTENSFHEEIIQKEAIISDEALSEQETTEGRSVLNEEGSNSGMICFDYLWKERLGNQQRELSDPVFTQKRISSHSVLHNSKSGNNQIDLMQSELMLGLISSYICFKSRLQPEYYYSMKPQHYDQEGVRIFTYSILSRRSKTKASITMTELLKLAAKRKQHDSNYLSNAIVHLVEGKIDRLLS